MTKNSIIQPIGCFLQIEHPKAAFLAVFRPVFAETMNANGGHLHCFGCLKQANGCFGRGFACFWKAIGCFIAISTEIRQNTRHF